LGELNKGYIFAWPLGGFLIRIQWLLVSDQSMQYKHQAMGNGHGEAGLALLAIGWSGRVLVGGIRASHGREDKCLRLLLVSGSQWIP
jgi:hypothetical protein